VRRTHVRRNRADTGSAPVSAENAPAGTYAANRADTGSAPVSAENAPAGLQFGFGLWVQGEDP
jgi:hypothetical protein